MAASTFVSDYYLRFRNASKAVVVPLDEIETWLTSQKVDIAINIHSFSECQLSAIDCGWRCWPRRRQVSLHRAEYRGLQRRTAIADERPQGFRPAGRKARVSTDREGAQVPDPVVHSYGSTEPITTCSSCASHDSSSGRRRRSQVIESTSACSAGCARFLGCAKEPH